MNIAVLICGEFREFEIAQKSWDFLRDLNADFFVSTWDVSIQEHRYNKFYLKENVNEEKIKKYLPNAKISILNQNNFISKCYDDSFWSINLNKFIFHWKNCFQMVKNENKEYDLVILMRCDSYVHLSNPIEKFLSCKEKDTIYGTSFISIRGFDYDLRDINPNKTKFQYFLFDTFFMGNYEVMSNFIEKCPDNIDTKIHHQLAVHVINLGYYVDVIENFKVVVVRPISRIHKTEDINSHQLDIDHTEWNKNYKL